MKKMVPGKYERVSCAFYSQLELLSLRKQEVLIRFSEGEVTKEIVSTIATLRTRNGEEYLVLENGKEIGLDKVKAIQNT